jgi:hypothetical protein
MTLKRLYYKLTAKVPTEELNYSVKDFQKGMRWAKSLPHPFINNRALDEYFYRWDSVEVLAYLNELIRAEKNKNA